MKTNVSERLVYYAGKCRRAGDLPSAELMEEAAEELLRLRELNQQLFSNLRTLEAAIQNEVSGR